MERESLPSASPSSAAQASDERNNTIALTVAPVSEVDDPVTKPSTLNVQIECPPDDNAANPQTQMPSTKALIFSSVSTTISAGLYIFDVVSNVLVAKHFYEYDFKDKKYENIENIYGSTGAFWSMIAAMVIGHIGCGIAFMTADLPRKKHPLWSAYFLPLVQFRRVLRNLWKPLSKGSRAPNEWRVEALYAIVSAAIEGGPLFVLQYSALAKNTTGSSPGDPSWRTGVSWKPPVFLILSLVVSAVSAIYNVIRAMSFIIPIRSICIGLVTGLFILSNLILQSIMVACLVVSAPMYFSIGRILIIIYAEVALYIPFIEFYFLTR